METGNSQPVPAAGSGSAQVSRPAESAELEEQRPLKQPRVESQKRQKTVAAAKVLTAPPFYAGDVKRVVGGQQLRHMDTHVTGVLTNEDAEILEQTWEDWGSSDSEDDDFSGVSTADVDMHTEVEKAGSPSERKPAEPMFADIDPDELYFPGSQDEPEFDFDTLQQLDAKAEKVELNRLHAMGVLHVLDDVQEAAASDTHATLTTRFVHTWRLKMYKGRSMWLRRARLVARDYARLDPFREGLFSPASSAIVTRLIPALYCNFRESKQWILMGLDISDAYLTCDQRHPTVISTWTGGDRIAWVLRKCVPGQRDGALVWYEDFSAYLAETIHATCCVEIPSLFRSENLGGIPGVLAFLLHVDDILVGGSEKHCQLMLDALQQRYKLSVSLLRKAGDEMTFLKRKHLLVRDDLLIMQPLRKHFQRLVDVISCDYIGSTPRKAPMPTGKLPTETHTDPLDEDRSQRYRSATGLLLYLAPDIVQAIEPVYGIADYRQLEAAQAHGFISVGSSWILHWI